MSARDHTSEYFRTLGVSCHASEAEIREAYYRLARVHHPDSNYGDPHAANRFKQIQFAYEQLSKRAVVEQPKDSERFPFVAPDPPRATVLERSLKACAIVITLAATLLGLAHLKFPIAIPPKVATNTPGQLLDASESPEAATNSAPPVVDEENDVRNTGDHQHLVDLEDIGDDYEYLPKFSTDVIEHPVETASAGATPVPSLDLGSQVQGVPSAIFSDRHETPADDIGSVQDMLGKSGVRREQSEIELTGFAAPAIGNLTPINRLESIDSWDAGITLLYDLRDALADGGPEGSLRMRDWPASTPSHKREAFSQPNQMDAAGIQGSTPYGTVRHVPRRRQPFSSEPEWGNSESRPDVATRTHSTFKRQAAGASKYDNLGLSSNYGSHGSSPAKLNNPLNQFDFGAVRESQPGTSSYRTDHFEIFKSTNTWSMREGAEFIHSKRTSTRLPPALPPAQSDKLATDRQSRRDLKSPSFSQQSRLNLSNSGRETDNWQPNNGLPAAGSKLSQLSPSKASPQHRNSLSWKPSASRLEVRKTVLPPYASKTASPHAKPRSHPSDAPRSKFTAIPIGR